MLTALNLGACQSGQDSSPAAKNNTSETPAKQPAIRKAGELVFRRSYSGPDEPMTDAQLEERSKARPSLSMSPDKILYPKMEGYGFVKDNELLVDKFSYDTAANTRLKDDLGNTIGISFKSQPDAISSRELVVHAGNRVETLKIDGFIQELKYKFLDIIPGGYPEIVILNEHHIMNGDNFDLLVFELNL